MNLLPRSLYLLSAADLMTTDLVLLPMEMSLAGAARIMSRAGVSGAPVVNHEGRLVGIFSATDYMLQWNQVVDHTSHTPDPECMVKPWAIPDDSEMEMECIVADVMTRDPVTVPGSFSIAELSRLMVEERIHRVVVTDNEDRPRGIVTTMDLLAAIAKYAPVNYDRGPKVKLNPFTMIVEHA